MGQGNSDTPSRDSSLDIVRSVAILLVVMIHTFEFCYCSVPGYGGSIAFAASHYFGRLSVPLFLILTGYLVLAKDFCKPSSVARFYKRTFPRLLVTVVFWTLIYSVCYVVAGEATPGNVVAWVLQLNQIPALNWWYVPMILSLYAALPLASRALSGLSKRLLVIPTAFVAIWGFIVPSVNSWLTRNGIEAFQSGMTSSYLLGPYGAYLVVGYAIRRNEIILRSVPKLPLLFVLAILSCFGIWQVHEAEGMIYWYDSLLIFVSGTILFLLLFGPYPTLGGRLRVLLSPMLEWVSKVSFAAYFAHYILILLMERCGVEFLPRCGMATLQTLVLITVTLAVLGLLWVATVRVSWLRSAIFHQR